MHTPPTSHLQGLARVINYDTTHRTTQTIWLSTTELARLFKIRFYYLEVKMTDARGGKGIATRAALGELINYVAGAKRWVAVQEKEMTNFDSRQFDVVLISSIGSRLLKAFLIFDRVMCDLAGAQLFGGQSDNLRVNYLNGFTAHIQTLLEICNMGPFHFYPDGSFREPVMA